MRRTGYVNCALAVLCALSLIGSDIPLTARAESVSGNSPSVSDNEPEAEEIRISIAYYRADGEEKLPLEEAFVRPEEKTAYYNEDIAAEFAFSGCAREDLAVFSVLQEKDGHVEELFPAGSLAGENVPLREELAADGSAELILDVPVTEDGAFRYTIRAEAGTVVLAAERDPAEPDGALTEEAYMETAEYETSWTLVRDTVRPVLTALAITPEEGVAHAELNAEHGNRYYFNRGFSVRAVVEDRNLAAEPGDGRLSFLRAEDRSDENSETAEFSELGSFSGMTGYSFDGEKAVFTDAASEDGVYAYALFGTDLAGNPVEFGPDVDREGLMGAAGPAAVSGNSADEENAALVSRYVVVDTAPPTGVLTITAGGEKAYVRETGAAEPTCSMPYQLADSAEITLAADASERTPVRVTLDVSEKNGTEEGTAESEGFIFHGSAVKKIDEKMTFSVKGGLIEDLAGNVSGPVCSRKIYLDKEEAEDSADTIAPVINVAPVIRDVDYDNQGRPLYRGDAQFKISVVEPYSSADGTAEADRASSGLKSVTWQVQEKAGGTSVLPSAGQLYHCANMVSEGGELFADEKAVIYAFDNGGKALTVPANELTNRNDLRIILTAEDNAGNRRVTYYDFGIDATAPAVTVTYDNNDVQSGRYFNAARRAVVTVTERNFDPAGVRVIITAKDPAGNEDSSLYSAGEWSARHRDASTPNGDADTFVREITFAEDGEYTLRICSEDAEDDIVCDAAGNRCEVLYDGAAARDFVIDTSAPSVSICADDGSVPAAADGEYYYRADNCGFRVIFEDNEGAAAVPEGSAALFTAELSGGVSKSWPADRAGEERALVFTAEEIKAAGDGPHTIRVRAVDAAGNEAESVDAEKSAGLRVSGLAGSFVLDTAAPVFRLSVSSPSSANRDLNAEQGNRYYFNSGCTVTVQVSETNFDADRITVKRGSVTGGLYDSSAVRIDTYDVTVPNVKNEDTGAQTYIFRDTLSENGVYRYAVFGSDKAGNALAPAPGTFNLDGTDAAAVDEAGEKALGSRETAADTSAHIVIDTVKPAGAVSVKNASGYEYYRMFTNGNVEKAEPYRSEDRAVVTFSTDTKTERSPVTLVYELTAQPASKSQSGSSKTCAFGNVLTAAVSGRQQFKVSRYVMTDLAGNAVTAVSGNFIFLDREKPDQDSLAPVTVVRANVPAAARSGSGQDLYSGDVSVDLKVSDPYGGQSSSGLADVFYEVYINGVRNDADTTFLHRANTEHTAGNYEDPPLDYALERTITIPAAGHNCNDIRLVVTARDNAGNVSANEYRFGIDVTPPKIRVQFDNNDAQNEKYFKEDRTALVTVTERNFDETAVNIAAQGGAAVSGWTHTAGSSANGDDDTWTASISCRTDGHYTLEVSCTDLAGWAAETPEYIGTAPRDFVLDKTAPVLSVSCDNLDAANEKYYKADRNVILTVSDANFGGENDIEVLSYGGGSGPGVSFSGMSAKLPFAEDGVYAFGGTVTDLAGNVSNRIGEGAFVIDKTLPVIELSGVEDLSANAGPLAIALRMSDLNLDENASLAALTGTNQGPVDTAGSRSSAAGSVLYELAVAEDDSYRLTYTASDLAGNSVSGAVSFSENRSGAVFEFLGRVQENGCASERFTPAYLVTDVDEVTILSVTLNGEEVPYTFADGRLTFENELPSDGKYVITADAADAAGNIRSDRREFIVDTKSPKLMVLGLAEDDLYFEEAAITLRRENPEDHFSEILLDGQALAEDGFHAAEENGAVTVTAGGSGEHELYVKMRDTAGNVTEWSYSFRVSDSLLLRWYRKKPAILLWLLLPAGLLLIFLVLLKRRKSEKQG